MIDDSVGGSSANSYISVPDADEFFNSSIQNDSWPSSNKEKEAALIEATRVLDSQFSWYGDIVSSDQALRWPRANVTNEDGALIPSDIVPKVLKDATCNLAYYLLANGGLNQSGSDLKEMKIGPIDFKYSSNKSVIGVPPYVIRALRALGLYNGASTGQAYNVSAIRS